MAGITNVNTIVTSTDATSFSTGALSSRTGPLMLVFAVATDCVLPNPVVTDSVAQPNAISFTKVASVTFGPSIHTLYCYVANRLLPNPANRNITVDYSPITATGSIINIVLALEMVKAGPAAIRQVATNPDGAAGVTPTATFPAPVLTTNSYVEAMANLTNPNSIGSGTLSNALTRITLASTGFATPTTGYNCYGGWLGLTAQTFTWGGVSATAWGTIAVELDVTPYTSQDTAQLEAGIGV